MRVVTLLSFTIGVVLGRVIRRTEGRRLDASTELPLPPSFGNEQPTSSVVHFDLPRWGQRIAATSEGLIELQTAFPIFTSPGVGLIYASFLQARHDTDDLGDALHDFGVRTNGGPEYGQLLVSFGQASQRLGSELSSAVLNSPDVQNAASQISKTGADLKSAVKKTKLPTSRVEEFANAVDLVGAFAGLFGK